MLCLGVARLASIQKYRLHCLGPQTAWLAALFVINATFVILTVVADPEIQARSPESPLQSCALTNITMEHESTRAQTAFKVDRTRWESW